MALFVLHNERFSHSMYCFEHRETICLAGSLFTSLMTDLHRTSDTITQQTRRGGGAVVTHLLFRKNLNQYAPVDSFLNSQPLFAVNTTCFAFHPFASVRESAVGLGSTFDTKTRNEAKNPEKQIPSMFIKGARLGGLL